jgi:hypothetical protein
MQSKASKGSVVLIVIITIAVIVVIGGSYWFFKGRSRESLPSAPTAALPKMANLPEKEPEIKPPPKPAYAPDAPVLEQARKALREGITPAEAVVMAKNLPDKPESTDAAFLLLEYAADGGNAEAAKAVGEYYDPSLDFASGSIHKNPTSAYEWYRTALAGGNSETTVRLEGLRKWLLQRAQEGSADAQALLENWR